MNEKSYRDRKEKYLSRYKHGIEKLLLLLSAEVPAVVNFLKDEYMNKLASSILSYTKENIIPHLVSHIPSYKANALLELSLYELKGKENELALQIGRSQIIDSALVAAPIITYLALLGYNHRKKRKLDKELQKH